VSTPSVSESAGTNANQDSKKILFRPLLNSDSLKILWIDAKAFTNLKETTKKKITFRFFIKSADSFTLKGWINEKSSSEFDSSKNEPDLKLFLAKKSMLQFGDGNYLGNLVLYNREIKRLIKLIDSTKLNIVLFIPVKPGPKYNQISYTLALTDEDPNKDGDFAVPPFNINLYTNPSPSRNSN
jgi:hypothetical protein